MNIKERDWSADERKLLDGGHIGRNFIKIQSRCLGRGGFSTHKDKVIHSNVQKTKLDENAF